MLRIANAVLRSASSRKFGLANLSYEVVHLFVEREVISNGGIYASRRRIPTRRSSFDARGNRQTSWQRELIDPRGPERLVQQFITDFFRKNETERRSVSDVPRSSAQIYHGDSMAPNNDLLRRRLCAACAPGGRAAGRAPKYIHGLPISSGSRKKPDALSRSLRSRNRPIDRVNQLSRTRERDGAGVEGAGIQRAAEDDGGHASGAPVRAGRPS